EIRIDPDAAGIEDAEIVLAVRDALVGRLAEPLRGGAIVGLTVDAFRVEHGEIVDRLGVPFVGARDIELAGSLEGPLHALAFFLRGCRGDTSRGRGPWLRRARTIAPRSPDWPGRRGPPSSACRSRIRRPGCRRQRPHARRAHRPRQAARLWAARWVSWTERA